MLPLRNLHSTHESHDLTLFGIPNCDQVRTARTWLKSYAIPYRFHDFKSEGLTRAHVERWLLGRNWTALINTRGTTWRKLGEHEQAFDLDSAVLLALRSPSVIRRPILERGDHLLIGFSEQSYREFLHDELHKDL